ncbi:MAG: response regulator [Deltaproteobacteria bacterium]
MTDSSNEQKPTILVVDDTPDNLTLITSLLKDLYRVKIAVNGRKALQITFSGEPPDLILLDIMMPEMDGYEVCRQLKGQPETRDIPVIFLTAKTEIEDEVNGFELGAADYITKPISPPILLARVRTHLRLKRITDYLKSKMDQAGLW